LSFDSQDRRLCRIWLTEAGKQLQTVLPPLAHDLREQVLQGVTHSERQRLSALIDLAIATLS
jgi:DNA-binding MarR family transcriptional regulator